MIRIISQNTVIDFGIMKYAIIDMPKGKRGASAITELLNQEKMRTFRGKRNFLMI